MCTSLFALFKLRWGRGVKKKSHTHTHKKNHPLCILHPGLFFLSSHMYICEHGSRALLQCRVSPLPRPAPSFKGKKKIKILKRKDAVVYPPKGLTAAVPSRCVAKDHLFLSSDAPVLSECLVSSLVRYCDCIRSKAKLFFLFFLDLPLNQCPRSLMENVCRKQNKQED